MELTINNEALKSAISEAILSQIDGAAREAMIREALKNVVEKRTGQGGYGQRPSVIEESFAKACANLTDEIVDKLVREDPQVREHLTGFARKAIEQLLTDPEHESATISAFASTFRKVIAGERY